MNNTIKIDLAIQEAELEALKSDYIHKAEAHLAFVKNLQASQIETDDTVLNLSRCRYEAVASYLSLHHFINRVQKQTAGYVI